MTMNLTVAGLNVLLRALSGATITFTKIQLGNGNQQSLDGATELANPLITIIPDSISTPENSSVTLSGTLNNSSVSSGFRLTEVGVYCEDPTDNTKEVLYAYGVEPSETANWIAPNSSEVQESTIAFVVFIGNAQNVAAQINQSLVYATKSEFDAHVADKANPHGTDKVQVGLGNVPNVTTNDQTPTWTEPASVSAPSSGETFSVIMGKITKAIKSLISHLANKTNPHEVTAAQTGAAPASHTHGASAINSGVLGTARGGTGKGNYTTNGLLYASSPSALAQVAAPSESGEFLTQSPSGAPGWAFASACRTGQYYGGANTYATLSYPASRGCPRFVLIVGAVNDPYEYGSLDPTVEKPDYGFIFGLGSEGRSYTTMQDNGTKYNVCVSLECEANGSAIEIFTTGRTGLNKQGELYNYFMFW